MHRQSVALWLRWSWRDLRRHWVIVGTLALVIALGTGAYAGLGGTTAWRIASNDASYAALHMHDLRVRLPDGAFAPAGALDRAVRGIAAAHSVQATAERLIVPTQVDASRDGRTVLVPGELVGMPVAGAVDTLHVAAGSGLTSQAPRRAVLEEKFAADYRLPDDGAVVVSGGHRVAYAGLGYTPEYFRVTGRSGSLLGETGFAVLFLPLPAAQAIAGAPGTVNDLVLRLAPDADRAVVRAQVASAVAALGATVTTRDDDPVHRGLYADARNDQKTWDMFAVLILLGAAVAAFNLVTRMVDAQRRELGVGMALGVPARTLALRPLLVGAQVAVGGVAAGVGVGWLMAVAMRRELTVLLPLPVWLTPFQGGRFAQAALLGLLVPLVATVLPLRRILRLQPVDAIRTGAYGAAGRAGGVAAGLRHLRLPGRTYVTMPLRDVLRAPRRTALTAVGVAAAVTCLVAVLGLLDSFVATGDRSAAELERVHRDRLTVTLTSMTSTRDAAGLVAAVPGVGEAAPQLRVPTRFTSAGRRVDAVTEVLDMANPVWTPTITAGDATGGLVLSEKAAADLQVRPGGSVDVQHAVRTPAGLRLVTSRMLVSGLHPGPLRALSYLDARNAAVFGLAGVANEVVVVPAPGVGRDSVLRQLFQRPGVAAVEPATGFSELLDYRLGQFTGILRVIEVVALLLALLIAFNTANLAADERRREHATMLAFGLPGRTVTAIGVAENAVIGLAGSVVGIGCGYLALRWIVSGFAVVMPDLSVRPTLFVGTIVWTLAAGVTVVALAPLLNVRAQRRMDVPATLRVVE